MGVEFNTKPIPLDEYRPKQVLTDEIPVIDLSPMTHPDPSNPKALEDLVAEIGDACSTWGFFTVINHGVALDLRHRIFAAAKKFFSMPLEEKIKVQRGYRTTAGYHNDEHSTDMKDWKEIFDFYVHDGLLMPATHEPDDPEIVHLSTPWPVETYPEFREECQEFARATEGLFFSLLELICLSLGLPANRLQGYFENPINVARLNHYPPCPSPELVLGTGPHKDPSVLTILAQEEHVEGLDVKRKSDGAWIRVKPVADAFVINVGDLIQVWSNDRYESVEHRVRVNSVGDRYSIPIFFHPSYDVTMKPLEEFVDDTNPNKFQEYKVGKWLNTRIYNNFKKRGFYMRLADYKIPA